MTGTGNKNGLVFMNNAISLETRGFKEARRQLDLYKLSKTDKIRIHRMLQRKGKGFIKRRLDQQVDLDGRAFKARKKGKGKMLVGRNNREYVRDADGNKLYGKNGKARRKTVGIKQNLGSRASETEGKVFSRGRYVASLNNDGGTERWDADKAEKIYGRDKYKAPASRMQAKRLLHLGYKRKFNNGKRTVKKRPTQTWIMKNMTHGQAGMIISMLKGVSKKKSWLIKVAKRSFMGATDQEVDQLKEYAVNLIRRYS